MFKLGAPSCPPLKVLFNYCPGRFLDPEYRKQLVLAELQQYNADIICLQVQHAGSVCVCVYLLTMLRIAAGTGWNAVMEERLCGHCCMCVCHLQVAEWPSPPPVVAQPI